MAAKKRNRKSWFSINTISILAVFAIAVMYIVYTQSPKIIESYNQNEVDIHYGKEIDLYASTNHLPAHYLKALAMLECSGRKDFPKRFEKHVYTRLREVKQGKRKKYEHVTPQLLKDADDNALRNLATSWGPFQIMGYKCIEMNIKIEDLRGENAVYWGIQWIEKSYGNLLRSGKFKDAFHIHNTGRLYPKNNKPLTHNPQYVANGLRYMELFEIENNELLDMRY